MEAKVAVITGADGAMGREITKAVANAGFHVVMACIDTDAATPVWQQLQTETQKEIDLYQLNLADYQSINDFIAKVKQNFASVDLLINNAGVLSSKPRNSTHNIELCNAVIYLGHYLLTHKLHPLMRQGTRVVNTVSLTYKYGTISNDFLQPADEQHYDRFKQYGNAKTALFYMSEDIAENWKAKGITSNCCDPGLVSTPIIRLNIKVIDKLCDWFFRPFIKTPKEGADTAIDAALNPKWQNVTGQCFADRKITKIKKRLQKSSQRTLLREITQRIMAEKNFTL